MDIINYSVLSFQMQVIIAEIELKSCIDIIGENPVFFGDILKAGTLWNRIRVNFLRKLRGINWFCKI